MERLNGFGPLSYRFKTDKTFTLEGGEKE